MFSACKELRDRRERARDGGTQKGVEHPEEEREAWKQHFETIQAGSGEVSESVWEHLGEPCEIEEWLGEEPDDDEIWKSAEKMKCGKAAGEDDVAVEMIRFAGNALKKAVCEIVRKHWREAGEAEAGNEADKWPDEWKIALQVPLWKKKGERSDKNTWRGITLSSVGTKLVARVVASRIQTWLKKYLPETQMGFRGGRGTDDALQVSRRVSEEVLRGKAKGE